jgi:hypothetical protein
MQAQGIYAASNLFNCGAFGIACTWTKHPARGQNSGALRHQGQAGPGRDSLPAEKRFYFVNLTYLKGGITAWKTEGLPLAAP